MIHYKINTENRSFDTYKTDTPETIANRLADELGTIKELLIFKENFEVDNKVLNSLDDIRNYFRDPLLSLNFKKMIFNFYLYKKQNIDVYDYNFYNQEVELLPNRRDIKEWANNSINFIKSIIKDRQKKTGLHVEASRQIEDCDDVLIRSNFLNNKNITTFYIKPDAEEIEMSDLFDECVVSDVIPFMSYNNIYKINNNFKGGNITEKWMSDSDDIMFKIITKHGKKNKNSYMNGSIKSNPLCLNLEFNTTLQIKDDIIKNFFNLNIKKSKISDIFDIQNTKKTNITSTFYLIDQQYDIKLAMDMIMNEPVFNYFVKCDETAVVTRGKNKIFLLFNNTGPLDCKVTASIKLNKIDNKLLRILIGITDENLTPGEHIEKYVTSVKINSNTDSNLEYCKYIIEKLFCIYNSKKQTYINKYKTFCPTFEVRDPIISIPPSSHKLKDFEPDIFLPGYKCNNKPKIVDPPPIGSNSPYIIQFPKKAIGKKPPLYYSCEHLPPFLYPGVQINKLDNNDDYPVLPCCFKTNQLVEKKQNQTITYQYYNNENIEIKQIKQQHVIITDKALLYDYVGTLNQIKLLNIIAEEKENYYRLGVCEDIQKSDPDSFIKCLLKATNRRESAEQIRRELADPALNYIPICKQEMYDYTEDQIAEILSDPTKYLRPNMFCSVMEEYFDCNIFIFSNIIDINLEKKNKKSIKGNTKPPELLIPRNTHGFLKYKRENCVFVYENTGSVANYFDFPICEIIYSIKPGQTGQSIKKFIFKSDDKISTLFTSILNSMKSFYVQGVDVTIPVEKPDMPGDLIGQCIDPYGKTRGLLYNFENRLVPVYIGSLPPLKLKTYDLDFFESIKAGRQTIREFFNTRRTKSIDETSDIISFELYGKKAFIKKKAVEKNSHLSVYKRNKKMAEYVKQLLFYNFSLRIARGEPVGDFADTFILVDNTVTYTIKNELIEIPNLIVKSTETKKRLVFLLKQQYIHNKQALVESHTINKFKINLTVSEMKKSKEYTVLDDFNLILAWTGRIQYKAPVAVTKLSPETQTPCFFINKIISPRPMYLMPFEHTIDVSSLILYSYINPTKIKRYRLGRENQGVNEITPKVIGFKSNAVPYFAYLHDISI